MTAMPSAAQADTTEVAPSSPRLRLVPTGPRSQPPARGSRKPRLIAPDPWQQANPNGSACSVHPNPEWFVEPQTKREWIAARAVCANSCPRTAECLADGLQFPYISGLWGGVWFVDGIERERFHKPRP